MKTILFSFFLLTGMRVFAGPVRGDTLTVLIHGDAFAMPVSFSPELPCSKNSWKEKLVTCIRKRYGENNKVVSAVLAFPVFGIVGLHRIYLGTKPYVPVVYIATLGGCAGILPTIDFIAILLADKEKFEKYKNNPRVFMWAE